MRAMNRPTKLLAVILTSLAISGCGLEEQFGAAQAVGRRVHLQIQAGNYASIYREAAPRFRAVGSEAQFVALVREIIRNHGKLEEAVQVGHEVGVGSDAGKVHVLTFDLQFENARTRDRLTIIPTDDGMKLWKLDIEPPVPNEKKG